MVSSSKVTGKPVLKYGVHHITTSISDNTGWSAAQAVYGEQLKHLLCLWHVDRYATI